MLFIGVFKELDGVDALIKLFRSRGKGVKGFMYFMPSWLMHSLGGLGALILPEKSCSSRRHFYSERTIFVSKTNVR